MEPQIATAFRRAIYTQPDAQPPASLDLGLAYQLKDSWHASIPPVSSAEKKHKKQLKPPESPFTRKSWKHCYWSLTPSFFPNEIRMAGICYKYIQIIYQYIWGLSTYSLWQSPKEKKRWTPSSLDLIYCRSLMCLGAYWAQCTLSISAVVPYPPFSKSHVSRQKNELLWWTYTLNVRTLFHTTR